MKYRPSLPAAKVLIEAACRHASAVFPSREWDLVVAVPSSRDSFLARKFNPALEIAATFCKGVATGRLNTSALTHLGSAAAQASLPAPRRIDNVRRSFQAKARVVAGKEILLIDDVVTSGSTSQACALALLEGGAAAVDLYSLCRSAAWPKKRREVYYGMGRQAC